MVESGIVQMFKFLSWRPVNSLLNSTAVIQLLQATHPFTEANSLLRITGSNLEKAYCYTAMLIRKFFAIAFYEHPVYYNLVPLERIDSKLLKIIQMTFNGFS